MDLTWSLKELYSSFNSSDFKRDFKMIDTKINALKKWADSNLESQEDSIKKIEEMLGLFIDFYKTSSKVGAFAYLKLSVNNKDSQAMKVIDQLGQKKAALAGPRVRFQKWLSGLHELDFLISSSEILGEHEFFLKELVAESQYLLSEKEEILIARMSNTGSSAWSNLQQLLTSTLLVEIEGEQLPLSRVRNMAYEKESQTRKTAYRAELDAYKKIEDAVAASLNSIKGEVITVSAARGFKSPLSRTLFESRMDRETLEAMLKAMKESLPDFRRYYRRKGELLGHKTELPFFDLFAPLGEVEMNFTYEQARQFIVDNFGTFSDRLADFARRAFDGNWIDVEPKEAKTGGAFCYNIHPIGESRILTNFTGNLSDVTTLAHELGHGYHGDCLTKESILNSDYPMPLAETASIFCETIIENAAIKEVDKDGVLTILENSISRAGQVIVDIYSRYLFETELFAARDSSSLAVEELKEMMLKAQKKAYGDGLDSKYLHPYMWVCKSHYYSASHNFYNFPYAFGLLFGKGLYAKYLEERDSFVSKYDSLLAATGKNSTVKVADMMGIDLHSVDFWRKSLKLIIEDINRFMELSS